MYHYTRMKQIVSDLQDCAQETGYSYSFLCQCVDEELADGYSYDEAMYWTLCVAYEHDF